MGSEARSTLRARDGEKSSGVQILQLGAAGQVWKVGVGRAHGANVAGKPLITMNCVAITYSNDDASPRQRQAQRDRAEANRRTPRWGCARFHPLLSPQGRSRTP